MSSKVEKLEGCTVVFGDAGGGGDHRQPYEKTLAKVESIVTNISAADILKKLEEIEKGGTINIPGDYWTSYSITSDFFKPADTFKLEMGGFDNQKVVELLYKKLNNGSPVKLQINGVTKLIGYIDKIDIQYSRSSGTTLSIIGRDKLGIVIDSCVTPETHAKPKDTLITAIRRAFEPFGYKEEDFIWNVNDEALHKQVGLPVGTGTQYSTRKSFRDPTRALDRKHQAKKHEGCMQYALRLAKHAGLFIKLTEDGQAVSLLPPIYDREDNTAFSIIHNIRQTPGQLSNTVLAGNIELDWSEQVSLIIMEGTAGGGNFRKQTAKTIIVNELVSYDENGKILPEVQKLIDEYSANKQTNIIAPNKSLMKKNLGLLLSQNKSVIRPLYHYDQEANTKEELEYYARRLMGDLQSKAITFKYTVQGHDCKSISGNPIWAPNMLCYVYDETLDISDYLWISKVDFKKSRAGTTTDIELQLPYIYDFDVALSGGGGGGGGGGGNKKTTTDKNNTSAPWQVIVGMGIKALLVPR